MRFLLDTNVVSELRKPHGDAAVRAWAQSTQADERFLSALVLGEVRRGVEQLRGRDPAQADRLDMWLAGLLSAFADRIVPVDQRVADRWGRIVAARATPTQDGLMAATAIVHGMTFVTRNVKDVAETGAQLLDPWTFSP